MTRNKAGTGNRLAAGLSEVLKERRLVLGLSQAELGAKAGLHRTYISEVERGTQNITIETLGKLAEALETSVLGLMEDATIVARLGSNPIEILLAEDNAADAHLVERSLKSAKIPSKLTVVQDGKETIDYLKNQGPYKDVRTPDLIFLDLNLPKKNGYEVLQEIKSDTKLKQVPVIVLTTSSSEKDIARSYELHANTFITKPIDHKQFQDAIVRILDYWIGIARLPTIQ